MNQSQAAAIDLKAVRLEKNAEAGALAGQKKARKNGWGKRAEPIKALQRRSIETQG